MHRDQLILAARQIAEVHAAESPVPRLRVMERVGAAAVMVTLWDAGGVMPTIPKKPKPIPHGECRAAILDCVGGAGEPLAAKEVIRDLRAAGLEYGASTVRKALAELTAAGELVNRNDKRGYRLPEWES